MISSVFKAIELIAAATPPPFTNHPPPFSLLHFSYSNGLLHHSLLFSMSSSSFPGDSATVTTSSYSAAIPTPPPLHFTNVDFGYAIAIALGFLVYFFTLILASYICLRLTRRPPSLIPTSISSSSENNGIILPRIIFVSEDDDGENFGDAVVGLNQNVINSYPKFPFSKSSKSESVCPICLCDYKDLEMLRMLPDCRHFFHLTCIDAWLKLNASCPVCRNSPLPTPLSTPLSEVVPLSQFSDGRNRRR